MEDLYYTELSNAITKKKKKKRQARQNMLKECNAVLIVTVVFQFKYFISFN